MFDVITFGSGVVDIFVNTKNVDKNNLICFKVGEKILIKDSSFDIGGGGTNTAVAFSRFGLKTGWIGKVSDDYYGKMILNLIKKEKVKFLGKIDKNKTSGYSIILNSKDKGRSILVFKGCNNYIGIKDIRLGKIKTKWIYCSSLLGKSFETQKKLIKLQVKKGVKFAFNPSNYLIEKKNLGDLFKICDVLVLNKEEAEMLVEKYCESNNEILKRICKLGVKVVVVTDKNNKIRCCDNREGKERKYYLKPNNIKVVERTGAGDAFASGFVAGQIVGKKRC